MYATWVLVTQRVSKFLAAGLDNWGGIVRNWDHLEGNNAQSEATKQPFSCVSCNLEAHKRVLKIRVGFEN